MNWDSIKDLVGKSAPVLGTILGGPAGGAIGSLISTSLGVEDTPEAVEKELKSNPEALLKLKKLEAEKIKEMNRHEERKIELVNENTDSARDMNVHIQESEDASNISKNAPYYLDFLIVGSTIILGMMLFFVQLPKDNVQITNILFGAMLGYVSTVFNYHRGSSKGSAMKQNTLDKINRNKK